MTQRTFSVSVDTHTGLGYSHFWLAGTREEILAQVVERLDKQLQWFEFGDRRPSLPPEKSRYGA